MAKVKLLAILGICGLVLAACGEESASTETPETQNVTTKESVEMQEESSEEISKESEESVFEYNQVIADNDNFKATLLEIEHVYDEEWDEERIEVRFDVENKRADTIEVQARSLSINGRMVDDGLQSMSQEVASGKIAEAVLTIEDYSGDELPTLEGDFEMLLHVFSWEDMDYGEDAEVKVTFE